VRLSLAVLPALLVLAGCTQQSAAPPTGVLQQVVVQVSCDSNSVTFNVQPWVRHLNPGDSISWTLATASNTQDVTIDRVNNRWPFNDPPPVHSRPNNPGHVGRMKSGLPHGDTYHYTVEADCQNGTGPKIHGKIDPDMIVD
jgi:plastocyanin